MALKHLKNALELLNAGMSINDIRNIIAMKDEPEQTEQTGKDEPNEPELEEETQDEPEQVDEPEQAEEPEKKEPEKKNPYQEKAKNVSSQESMIEELNKIF